MIPSLHVLLSIAKLRSKGLGWRQIAKRLCSELRVCVSFKTVERWFKRYLGVNRVSLAEVSSVNKLSREPAIKFEEDVIKKQYGRLGRTERLVLSVILSEPSIVWTAAAVAERLKRLGYRISRCAVYAAMRRLARRGVLARIPNYVESKVFKYEIVKGEVIKGGFRLVALEPSSFAIHNLRVPRLQVISNDLGVNLSSGLFVGEVMVGEAPITQLELNSDIPMPREFLKYLRESLGWGFTVIYPKVKEGVLRVDHRFWPKDLILSVKSKDEIEARGRLVTKLLYDVLTYEVARLRASDGRRVLRPVSLVL